MTKAKTLAELEDELETFYLGVNDENEDTPEILAAMARSGSGRPSTRHSRRRVISDAGCTRH
jgi:hypothetical protein